MKKTVIAMLALTSLCAARAARAENHIVDIQWTAQAGFEHSASIAAGKFVEVCGKLAKGSTVKWQFETSGPSDFNIHYHQGKQVVFPAKVDGAEQGTGSLSIALEQDYCWMWTNKAAQAVSVKLTLKR